MKSTTLSLALAAISSLALSPAASAADGSFHFYGEVVASTCDVTPGQNAEEVLGEIAINLPKVGVESLATDGATAGAKAFQVVIGGSGQAGCIGGATNRASIAFDSISNVLVDNTTGRLKNSGTANNVQVELVNSVTGKPINLFIGSNVPEAEIVANKAVLDLGARYVANGGPATEGSVDTTVAFTVVYF